MKRGTVFESFCAVCKEVTQHMQLLANDGPRSACRQCRVVKQWAREHDSCFLPVHREPGPTGEGFAKAKLSGEWGGEWKEGEKALATKVIEELTKAVADQHEEIDRLKGTINKGQHTNDEQFRVIEALQQDCRQRTEEREGWRAMCRLATKLLYEGLTPKWHTGGQDA